MAKSMEIKFGSSDFDQLNRRLFNEFLECQSPNDLADKLKATLPFNRVKYDLLSVIDIADEIMSNFLTVAERRLFLGLEQGGFFGKMFDIYREGMWPCGWRSVDPLPGKFIAYCRDS